MKITIEAEPKEIAAYLAALGQQQNINTNTIHQSEQQYGIDIVEIIDRPIIVYDNKDSVNVQELMKSFGSFGTVIHNPLIYDERA